MNVLKLLLKGRMLRKNHCSEKYHVLREICKVLNQKKCFHINEGRKEVPLWGTSLSVILKPYLMLQGFFSLN